MGEFISVGYGGVGQAVPERAASLGLEQSRFTIRSNHTQERQSDGTVEVYSENPSFWEDDKIMQGVELAFVTIPSDKADAELAIIEGLQARDIPVVTAAKGALAEHFERIEPNLESVGKSATLGGGTRILPWLADRLNSRVHQAHGVVNGTINYIMHGIDEGETAGQMIDQAGLLKFAEPGATNHLEVLNGELIGDIPKKTSILWNVAFRPVFAPDRIIRPEEIEQPELAQDGLNELIKEAGGLRYILSIMRDGEEKPEEEIIPGFRLELEEGWVIKGGFRRLSDNPLFKHNLWLPGAGNGIVITGGANESDGVYALSGPGAGPGPTATSLALDGEHLLSTTQ